MEEKLSQRVKNLKPSATLEINKKAKELKNKGVDVINFAVGEPDFDTPAPIKEAAISAINSGFTKYTAAQGIIELREAVCEKLLDENKLSFSPDQIIVSNGAKHSLFNVMLAILNPGDEVIIPSPYWVSYPAMITIAGGKPVFCKWNEKFKLNIEHLKSLINKKTKALILNSPCNPTGVVYTKEELEQIAEILVRNKIICISDEVYEKIIYDDISHISIASLNDEIKESTIVVNGVSKTFAMTGWRIGYIACEESIAKAVGKIQGQTTSNPSAISQKAALYAIKYGKNLYEEMVNKFCIRRKFLLENLPEKLFYPRPDGAFYLFIKFGNIKSEELARRLLEEKYVAVVPGKDFGADDFVRISFALNVETLQKAVERIKEFVKENAETAEYSPITQRKT